MSAESSKPGSTCPRCGTALTADEAGGRCPRCLVNALFAADAPRPELAPSPAATDGRRVGDYELIEEIARGGMGIVYRARQVSLDRIVAVKLMRDSALAGTDEVRRFKVEAAAAAKLKHPNIVAIHEVGEQDGQHWFAMDLVEGVDLAQHTREGPLPPRAAAGLVATIADAVQHAHERGVLHRDLKPSNVLIDVAGQPFVTDFGLARTLEGDSSLTLTGQVLGTPGYMPPEQATGRGTVGPAADIYSLGAVLYHLLTGRAPFVGESAIQVIQRLSQDEPLSPSLLNPGVPDDLAAISLKCLEKDPRRRYALAAALKDDLDRWRRSEPTLARPIRAPGRLWRWSLRNRALAATAVVALLGLIGAALVFMVAAVRLSRERDSTRAALWQSWVEQARAERTAGVNGARERGLQAVTNAARVRASLALRNEAVGLLSLTDLGQGTGHAAPKGAYYYAVSDAALTLFATPAKGGEILVGRADTGEVTARWSTGTSEVHFLAMRADGRYLGAFLSPGQVAVWDVSARRELWRESVPPFHGATPFEFHPTQPLVVLRTGTNHLRLVEVESGRNRGTMVLPAEARRFTVSPDGSKLALQLMTGDGCSIWDVERQIVRQEIVRHQVDPMTWDPTGRQVALGDDFGHIVLWDAESGAQETWLGDPHNTAALRFHPDGRLLISGHWNGFSQLWDVATGQRLSYRRGLLVRQISADGQRAGWNGDGGRFGQLRIERPAHLRTLAVPLGKEGPGKLAYHPNGQWMASLHLDGLSVWDMNTARLLAFRAAARCGADVIFSPDGKSLLTTYENRFWRWPWSAGDSNEPPRLGAPRRINGEAEPLRAETPSMFARLFPTDLHYHLQAPEVRFVDRHEPTKFYELKAFPQGALSASRTAPWIGMYAGKGLQIRRLTGEVIPIRTLNPGGFVQFSPDGRSLMHYGNSFLELIDAINGQLKWRVTREHQNIDRLCFSHDGRTVAIGGNLYPSVWLLDAATGTELATLQPQGNHQVTALTFSPDDQTLAVGHGRQILLWDLVSLRRQLASLGLDWERERSPVVLHEN